MKRIGVLLLFAALPCIAPAVTPATADDVFTAIYTAEWKWRAEQFPGLGRDDDADADESAPPDDHLAHVDAASQAARLAYWDKVLKQLADIPRDKLSPEQRINYDVYKPQIENLAADIRFKGYEMPLNSDSQFWSDVAFLSSRHMKNAKDVQQYIGKLNDFPRYFDENMDNMRLGLKRGFTVPKAVLVGRDVSISTYTDVKSPRDSDFFKPCNKLPSTVPAAEQTQLQTQCETAIRDKVLPSYTKLLKFFKDEYVPHARDTLAAEALPDGVAYYRQQIKEYTTLDLDPEAIHQIGLKEVERIDGEMKATIASTHFQGSFADFQKFLRTDPQFYAKTPLELLSRAAWIAKRVDGELSHFFSVLPRGRFTIKPVPDAIAPFWTAGRGGAHTYWVNTYDLPSRSLYNLPALTLHESAPGHSFQGELAEEQKAQPKFRSKSYISAYGEGWALYCEKLGKEMGIYETPYEEFGRESYEMWRAARLVIDTGVHHKGWTRDQAIAFLAGHTALSQHEVETEVDRYISWPGQALSYKLGEIKIVELRAKAEKELGPKFDIRKFHDAVLDIGSVPLPVLEARIDKFIADARAAKA